MARDFHHTLASFYGSPWAILPAKLTEIEHVLLARIARHGETSIDVAETAAKYNDSRSSPRSGEDKPFDQVEGVAIIGIRGTIMPRASIMADYSGGVSAERIGRAVDAAAADKSVTSIVLDVDSPGGSVYGVEETAVKIAAARNAKRVVAVANPVIASAAYYLASQATEIVVTPSGQVGAVGIIAAHVDRTEEEKADGRKTTLVHAGQFKVERYPTVALTAGSKAAMQEEVDQYYAMFLAAVAKGRGLSVAQVEDRFGQGRMKLAEDAIRAGMADRVGTLQSVLQQLVTASASTAPLRTGAADADRRARAMAVQFAERGLPTG